MKRLQILLAALVLLSTGCSKNEETTDITDILVITDDLCNKMDDLVFMKYCYDNFDVNQDGKLSRNEANAVKVIKMFSKNSSSQFYALKSLKGIDSFPNLIELDCTGTSLESVNLSKNTKLEIIDIDETKITSIDVSKCTELKELGISGTKISQLNLTKNTKLEDLYAYNSGLTSIDVSKCPELKYLNLGRTKVTDLDISNNTKIERLYFGDEGLTVKINCTKIPYYESNGASYVFSCNGKVLPSGCYMVWEGKVYNEKNYNGEIEGPGIDIGVGEEITLNAVPYPDNTSASFLWESADGSIAVVKDGVVKGIKEGSVYIYAIPTTGGQRAYSYIWVRPAAKRVKIIDGPEINVNVGDSWKISYSLEPSGAADRGVIWSSSDENVLYTGDYNYGYWNYGTKAFAKAPGTAILTVKTKSGGLTATCKVTVNAKNVSVTGVSLDNTSLTLQEGKSATLSAIVSPSNATDKSVSWSSSNVSVATVSSSGVVTAKKSGTATITAKTNDGGKTATCKVTVTDKAVSVTGVTISPSSLSIAVGQTSKLSANISPDNATNKNVTWSSNNTSVATVSSDGTVTAKSVGTTTITCITQDGAKKATCIVSVQNTAIAVTGVSIDKTTMNLLVGNTGTLHATIYPSNASNQSVTWLSSNTSVATVSSSGVVTAKAVGSVVITVKTNNNCTAKCSVSVSNSDVSIVNIPDNKFKRYLRIYYDTDKDGEISDKEAENITSISVKGSEGYASDKIYSLVGIEHMPNLTKIVCDNNMIEEIDLSNNKELLYLSCNYNQLTSLEVSSNTKLQELYCYNNKLSSLYVSDDYALTTLLCDFNNLTTLNVANNTKLFYLSCISNKLTGIDVSMNTALRTLHCSRNELSSLDISNNICLEELGCTNNQLTTLDVSNNTSLSILTCGDNKGLTVLYSSGQPVSKWSEWTSNAGVIWKQ